MSQFGIDSCFPIKKKPHVREENDIFWTRAPEPSSNPVTRQASIAHWACLMVYKHILWLSTWSRQSNFFMTFSNTVHRARKAQNSPLHFALPSPIFRSKSYLISHIQPIKPTLKPLHQLLPDLSSLYNKPFYLQA